MPKRTSTVQDTETARATILRSLKNVSPLQFREDQLLSEIDTLIPRSISAVELQEHLEFLRSKGWVDFEVSPMGGVKKWFITDEGKSLV